MFVAKREKNSQKNNGTMVSHTPHYPHSHLLGSLPFADYHTVVATHRRCLGVYTTCSLVQSGKARGEGGEKEKGEGLLTVRPAESGTPV